MKRGVAMGLASRGISSIRIKASSKRTADSRDQEIMLSRFREIGIDPGALSDPHLRTLLRGDSLDQLNAFLSDAANIEASLEFLGAIRRYDTAFAKNLAEGMRLPGDADSSSTILPLLGSQAGAANGASEKGQDEFLISVLSSFLGYATWSKKDLDSLPEPFNYYWLSRTDSSQKMEITETLEKVMRSDLEKGSSRSTKIAYGFLVQNSEVDSSLQMDILERGLKYHRDARDKMKVASPFGEVLSYGFEYAPVEDRFDDILRETFPILMDFEGKVGYRQGNYAFEDLAIVSNIFYNENIDLSRREKVLDDIMENYESLSERITQVPLNQFFENLNLDKISANEENRILDGLGRMGADPFRRDAILQSIARNRNLSDAGMQRIYDENQRNMPVLENLARNLRIDEGLLDTLRKKGNTRVKRVAEETARKLGI